MLYDILWLLIDQTLSHMSNDNDPFSYFRIDSDLFINAATDLSFCQLYSASYICHSVCHN